jgi:hypothetical protein
MVQYPTVLVLTLSIPSTGVPARLLGSNGSGGTSHKVRTSQMVELVLLGVGGSGDKRDPRLGCAGQLFHLPAACDPTHIGNDSIYWKYHSVQDLCRGQSRSDLAAEKNDSGPVSREKN